MQRFEEEEWQRRKEYLVRSMFAETLLSPILEQRESLASPHPPVAYAEGTYSPLPDLIIEKEKRYEYEDETEEFYNRLEIKMKRFYRKIFLGEDIDIELSAHSVPDYSNDEAGFDDIEVDEETRVEIGGDDIEIDKGARDETGDDDFEGVDEGKRNDPDDNDDDDFTVHILTEEEGGSEETPDAVQASSSENLQGKLQESLEETDVTDSEASHTTTSESGDKSDAAQERLANILAKIYSLSSSDENGSQKEATARVIQSQTYTEKPDQSEGSSGPRSKTVSESSEAMVVTLTEKALVHTRIEDREIEERQLEVMRRQRMLLEDSFVQHSEAFEDNVLELNIQHSMEELSTINTSVPIEIDSFVQPTRITSPLKEVSPVIPLKRSAAKALQHIGAKRVKKNHHEVFERSREEIETGRKVQKDVDVDETEVNLIDKEIQADIIKPSSVGNAAAQTDCQDTREVFTEMSTTTQADVGIQTDSDSIWLRCRHFGTQTEERENIEEGTQTQRGFEYYRLSDEINFFFFF